MVSVQRPYLCCPLLASCHITVLSFTIMCQQSDSCFVFSCLNNIVFFSSCQVRLKGPKLLEHSLATMWHQFESFHQFLLTDTTGSTTNEKCKIQSVCTATVHYIQNHCPPHTHKHKTVKTCSHPPPSMCTSHLIVSLADVGHGWV